MTLPEGGLTYDELSPNSKALTNRALAGRGTIRTFNILLRRPGLSDAIRGSTGTRAIGSTLSAKKSGLPFRVYAFR